MQIKIKKLFNTDGTHTTIEELYITLPKGLVDELGWEDGTLIEIERTKVDDDGEVTLQGILLRNIDDDAINV
jgi:bifunctional DNA-binding transcriptional regulator/antitoxin component of YhaV-PrlF toxin-antitoxin module|tara:strand:- start:235 stop:450 length:216 start_codon:yes stop_codon:yes gene_type:complete